MITDVGVQLQVSNYKFFKLNTCNWIPIPFARVLLLLKVMKNVTYWLFCSKKVLKRLGFQHLLLIRLISNWTPCHTLQGIIVLVIFKCVFIRFWNYSITPWIVRHSVQLLLQIESYLRLLGQNSCPTRPNFGGGGGGGGTPDALSRL